MTQPSNQPGPRTPEEQDQANKGAAAGTAAAAGCALYAIWPWVVIGLILIFFLVIGLFSWRG